MEEFYLKLSQIDVDSLYKERRETVRRCFGNGRLCGIFDLLCESFGKFARKLCESGFFHALCCLRDAVGTQTMMMNEITGGCDSFTDVQKEKIGLHPDCFLIKSNEKVIDNRDICEVIVPAYHPVMLKKIDAQQIFLRDGFAETLTNCAEKNEKLSEIAFLPNLTG